MLKVLTIILIVLLCLMSTVQYFQIVLINDNIEVLDNQQATLLLKLEEENIARRAAITKLDEVTFEADKALAEHQNIMVDYMNNNLVTAEYIEYMYEVFDVRTRDLKSMIENLQGE